MQIFTNNQGRKNNIIFSNISYYFSILIGTVLIILALQKNQLFVELGKTMINDAKIQKNFVRVTNSLMGEFYNLCNYISKIYSLPVGNRFLNMKIRIERISEGQYLFYESETNTLVYRTSFFEDYNLMRNYLWKEFMFKHFLGLIEEPIKNFNKDIYHALCSFVALKAYQSITKTGSKSLRLILEHELTSDGIRYLEALNNMYPKPLITKIINRLLRIDLSNDIDYLVIQHNIEVLLNFTTQESTRFDVLIGDTPFVVITITPRHFRRSGWHGGYYHNRVREAIWNKVHTVYFAARGSQEFIDLVKIHVSSYGIVDEKESMSCKDGEREIMYFAEISVFS